MPTRGNACRGPFVEAWLKVYLEDLAGARQALEGFTKELNEYGIGTISEVFDAEEPFSPRGCIAQAWLVAEVLRGWLRPARWTYLARIFSSSSPSSRSSWPYFAQSPARCASMARS